MKTSGKSRGVIHEQSIRKKDSVLETAADHWRYVAPVLVYPRNEADYQLLVKRLDTLLDTVGEDENHPLMGLVDALSALITVYEEKHVSLDGEAKGIAALKYLMELHDMTQADLVEIGSQGVVSEILNGKRKLNVRQIAILSRLFKVDPATFIDETA